MSLTTRWLPRTVDNACKNVSLVMLYILSRFLTDRLGCLIRAKNRCSTETYSSPMDLASSSALISTLFKSLLM